METHSLQQNLLTTQIKRHPVGISAGKATTLSMVGIKQTIVEIKEFQRACKK